MNRPRIYLAVLVVWDDEKGVHHERIASYQIDHGPNQVYDVKTQNELAHSLVVAEEWADIVMTSKGEKP